MEFLTTMGATVACCGVLFFIFCAALVFWYLFNQPKQVVSETSPEPGVQSTIEHPTAGTPAPKPEASEWAAPSAPVSDAPNTPSETPGVDG